MSNKTFQTVALALGLASAMPLLQAQDRPEPPSEKVEKTDEAGCESKGHRDKSGSACKRRYSKSWKADFGASFQTLQAQKEMKDFLSDETGYGVGLQWWHERGGSRISRTRFEWNVFPEGTQQDGSKGKAKQYLIGWDHLIKLNQGPNHAYVLAGLGGVRWCLEDTRTEGRHKQQTTKLHFTGGLGVRVANSVALEARYVVSSINKTFDGNTTQFSLSWCF